MAAKQQKFILKVPDYYGPSERKAIGVDVVTKIRERTEERGVDKSGRTFAKYSDGYKKSLDFKIAGKSSKVDLTLSGDMLGALKVLDTSSNGTIVIGFERGSEENARAEGNILGSYGKTPGTGPRRDFLGLPGREIQEILKYYPKGVEARERAAKRLETREAAEIIGEGIERDGD